MSNRKQDIILAIVLSLFIITFAVCFTVFQPWFYPMEIDALNITGMTGLTKDVLIKNYQVLIQYQSIFYQGTLELPNFIMSQSGRIHFEEVKRVFEIIQVVCMITGGISIVMIYRNIKQKEYRFLRLTSIYSIVAPLVIGLFASIDFDQAFVIFHQIVFRNDYWIFNSVTDPVINALPEDFFMHSFMMIVFIVLALSALLYGIYKYQEKKILA